MLAAVNDRYGPPGVVRVAEVADPSPGPDEVLLRVAAVAVTAGDARLRAARFPRGFGPLARLGVGIRRPRRRTLGMAVAGTVVAVGADVRTVAVGDEVAGMTGTRLGAHAELVAMPAARVVPIPVGVAAVDAAGVLFGGTTAWHFLTRRAELRAGARVLIVGASGAVGTHAVQLAARAGALVTGVCSGRHADLVRGLGAAEVIDRRRVDVASLPERYDIVLDAAGVLTPATGRRLLTDDGVLLLLVADLWQTITARGPVRAGVAPERPDDMARLLDLVAQGELRVVVDRVLPLQEIAEAHRLVDSGDKVGTVVVAPGAPHAGGSR